MASNDPRDEKPAGAEADPGSGADRGSGADPAGAGGDPAGARGDPTGAGGDPTGPGGDPAGAGGDPRPGTEPDPDALSRLAARLDRASEAAERLFAEAESAATRPRKPPSAGWQAAEPEGDTRERRPGLGELETLLAALASLRELIPPDLQRRLADALRELLVAVRALIDWYLERAKHGHPEPAEVQDIPIA
jgi:hypothetical protein